MPDEVITSPVLAYCGGGVDSDSGKAKSFLGEKHE